MIGGSRCFHLSSLILLLLLHLACANTNSPTIASPSSSTSSASSSSTLPQTSSSVFTSSHPPSSSSTSSPTESTNPHQLDITTESSSETLSASSNSQSVTTLPNNSQSEDDLLSTNQTEGSSQSPHTMNASSPSSSAPEYAPQNTPTGDLTITKRAKFKLHATEKEKKLLNVVEKLFLQKAGLRERPRITSEFAVPEYMLDLYQIQAKHKDSRDAFLKVKGNGMIAANTVRSFLHSDTDSSTCQPPLCSRVYFDITSIPEHETITGAELRIFAETKNPGPDDAVTASSQPSDAAVGSPRHNPADSTMQHRLEVHEIMRPASPNGDAITRLLDTRVVKLDNSSWQSFDIQPAVLKWKRGHQHNHGLEIKLVSKAPTLSIDNHVRLRRAVHLPDREWALQRPLLVVYTLDGTSASSHSQSPRGGKSSSSKPLTKLRRKRRSADDEDAKTKKKNRRRNRRKRKKKKKKKKRRRKKQGNKSICKRHSLYVNFRDVGWDDWIVAPTGYGAYYCHGDCMAPLPDFSKASNHAMLQARVYKVNPAIAPMVCCVPTKMSVISMLYRDEKGRTVLKTYQDMVVEECGCK